MNLTMFACEWEMWGEKRADWKQNRWEGGKILDCSYRLTEGLNLAVLQYYNSLASLDFNIYVNVLSS